MELEQIIQLLLLLLFLFGGVIGQVIQRKRRSAQDQADPATQAGRPRGRSTPEGEIARRVREMLEAAQRPKGQAGALRPRVATAQAAASPRATTVDPPPRSLSSPLGVEFEKEFARFQDEPGSSWAERPDSLLASARETIHTRVHPRARAFRGLLQKDPRLAVLCYEVLGPPLGMRPLPEGPSRP